MDTCYWNNSYITTINVLLVTCPLCWGIYELRKLTKLLQTYKTTIDKLEPKVFSMQTLIDNVSKEQLTDYPFIEKINVLLDKSNRILH